MKVAIATGRPACRASTCTNASRRVAVVAAETSTGSRALAGAMNTA